MMSSEQLDDLIQRRADSLDLAERRLMEAATNQGKHGMLDLEQRIDAAQEGVRELTVAAILGGVIDKEVGR